MVFGLFGGGERANAKKMTKLAQQTIDMMQEFLSQMEPNSPDKAIIEDHLVRRKRQIEGWTKRARGEADELDILGQTAEMDKIYMTSMENEIYEFGGNAETFVWYLKQIKEP